jgi:AAA family ATP:ADP antiporter
VQTELVPVPEGPRSEPGAKARLLEHPVEFLLGVFGDVRPGEAPTVLLLTLDVFLLLTAYYLLKVAREPLILLGAGAEVKSYASVIQAGLLIGVANAYSWLASRLSRIKLIAYVTVFFVSNLLLFWLAGSRGARLGVPFFLWVGLFNIVSVAQFWTLAADTYTEEQGKRLFPVIGIGSSVGAVCGSVLAEPIVRVASPLALMLVAAAILLVTLGITFAVHRRESRGPASATGRSVKDEPVAKGNAFALVLRNRYLLLLAALIFILNIITKTGDYVLDRMLIARAHEHAAALGVTPMVFIAQFKARYFDWINVLGVVLQSFLVSRIIKFVGIRGALLMVPIASLTGYGAALVVPALGVILVTRVAESTLDYSLSNTVRQALWLVTSREAKYKGKQVVDTFVWRAGDVASAGLVWLGARVAAPPRAFLALNVVFAAIWVMIAFFAGRAYSLRLPADAHGAGPLARASQESVGRPRAA